MKATDLGVFAAEHTLRPGPYNAITDVAGVRVGHRTLIDPERPVRTGVTVVLPHEGEPWRSPVFAGHHVLNGNGEVTGLVWLRESGLLTTPVGLTNTHSVGVVRDALVAYEAGRRRPGEVFWSMPVVGETYDGVLNDINGQHVHAGHVAEALEAAASGPVAEGCVGGGTGMIAYGFKGGIGTASRVLPEDAGGYTVGVLVQANYGRREQLRVAGVPVGRRVPAQEVPLPGTPAPPGSGSIIVVAATDAPLLPGQCDRLAQRAGLAIGRLGGVGAHASGDIFLAFATGVRTIPEATATAAEAGRTYTAAVLANQRMTPLFEAVIEATEEAVVNAMLQATTLTGPGGVTAHALTAERLRAALG